MSMRSSDVKHRDLQILWSNKYVIQNKQRNKAVNGQYGWSSHQTLTATEPAEWTISFNVSEYREYSDSANVSTGATRDKSQLRLHLGSENIDSFRGFIEKLTLFSNPK